MKLSICIPTYNRAELLENCLQSIISNVTSARFDYEVCVSDNCSGDKTEEVVCRAQENIVIKYNKNKSNLGRVRNYLNVVDMAEGEFIWLVGDDDLLMPLAIEKVVALLNKHESVDFFYINSFHLTTEYVFEFPQPFDTVNLPKDMVRFSAWQSEGEVKFMDLVRPEISFDYLGGMFLAVFRRENWLKNVGVLNQEAVLDERTFSHFDNTFPHLKIFANAFAESNAYFYAAPLSVCLTGAREWSPMSPLIYSVRLIEALDEYRKNGLPYIQYLQCKNSALRSFIPDCMRMYLHKNISGYEYINPLKLIMQNCLYPNFYLSIVYFIINKLGLYLSRLKKVIQVSFKVK